MKVTIFVTRFLQVKNFITVDAFDEQNEFGLYNIIGNVWEWTADKFARYHDHEPDVDPKGSPRGQDYVKKGGSFLSDTEHSYRFGTTTF